MTESEIIDLKRVCLEWALMKSEPTATPKQVIKIAEAYLKWLTGTK